MVENYDHGYDCQVENDGFDFPAYDCRAIIETTLAVRYDRVKIVAGTFPAKNLEELFFKVPLLWDWETICLFRARFPISKAKCVKSKLHNEPSVQAFISKKQWLKSCQNTMPDQGVLLMENGAEFVEQMDPSKTKATVLIDTTGSSLFKRGYRPSGKPLT